MKEHGEAAHIVNTGSMASHLGLAGTGDYTAAKFGVAGLSEVLRSELAGSNIGISVLCPGYTDTGLIANSRSLMPAGEAARLDKLFGSANTTSNMSAGLDHAIVGELVRKGIEDNRFWRRLMWARACSSEKGLTIAAIIYPAISSNDEYAG